MAIIAQGFETLITNKGTEKCDFGELLERSRQIKEQWQNSIKVKGLWQIESATPLPYFLTVRKKGK